ncbi:hypothetical protein F8388_005783 [Cannabis sativa]|uniref:Ubiquitin-like protease family profile domain-containing protein n=1 Tax=Cannabis sativa TaxID=3483 RepID=A0A7J6HMQ2_CANSA|nr:hypothetical protein F8388_005783 [Cannabis sativa]
MSERGNERSLKRQGVSLSLNDFFSGDTTPDAVKFKVKGGSKSVGQPDLMGASSSSAHENVSRLEFEELKKCFYSEQYQVVEENIDVDATIASAIGSSTNVSASAETSEKNDLEMIRLLFYVLKRGIGRKELTTTNVYFKGKDTIFPPFRFGVEDISNKISLYDKFVEKNNDISVLSLSHNVAQYIRGGKILCATPWHLVHHVVMPMNVKLQDHWICGRLNIAERRIYLYNSLRSERGLRNEPKFSTMESFPIVAVDGLPEQVTADCGVFVASFAEYFIDGKPIPSSGFDVEIHRDHLVVLFYHYGMKKQLENIKLVKILFQVLNNNSVILRSKIRNLAES